MAIDKTCRILHVCFVIALDKHLSIKLTDVLKIDRIFKQDTFLKPLLIEQSLSIHRTKAEPCPYYGYRVQSVLSYGYSVDAV